MSTIDLLPGDLVKIVSDNPSHEVFTQQIFKYIRPSSSVELELECRNNFTCHYIKGQRFNFGASYVVKYQGDIFSPGDFVQTPLYPGYVFQVERKLSSDAWDVRNISTIENVYPAGKLFTFHTPALSKYYAPKISSGDCSYSNPQKSIQTNVDVLRDIRRDFQMDTKVTEETVETIDEMEWAATANVAHKVVTSENAVKAARLRAELIARSEANMALLTAITHGTKTDTDWTRLGLTIYSLLASIWATAVSWLYITY